MTSAGDERPAGRARRTRASGRPGAARRTPAAGTGRGAALLRGIPLAVVLVVVVAGIALAAFGHWKRGAVAVAAASALALVLRLVLPGRYVGPLAVRSRRFDIAFLVALTGLLTAAAILLVGE